MIHASVICSTRRTRNLVRASCSFTKTAKLAVAFSRMLSQASILVAPVLRASRVSLGSTAR